MAAPEHGQGIEKPLPALSLIGNAVGWIIPTLGKDRVRRSSETTPLVPSWSS